MKKALNYQDETIDETLKKIIADWRDKEGNTIMIFHAIQSHYGYVPRNVAVYVADELGVQLAKIYEVLTFYSYFNLEPPAENTIAVCTGTACYLKGSGELIKVLREKLKISEEAQYSEDRKFKLEEVRCIGCCGLAPVVTFNGEIHGKMTVEKIPEMLAKAK